MECLYGIRYLDRIEEATDRATRKALETFVGEKLHQFYDLPETLQYYQDFEACLAKVSEQHANDNRAFLACNDRFYLLTQLLGREDLKHPWLFDRCREVEAAPYGRLDLWARYHGKTSLITVGGILQEIIRDPEVTIAIFSATKPLAKEILGQIKSEFETNDTLKQVFKDILYENPRGRTTIFDEAGKKVDERPTKWSLERGITVRRNGHPKEATVEAHGLIDGQPTGRHFHKHYYDDIVTQDFLSEEQLKKTAERFELADNLGTRYGVDKCISGTRYHFADAYGIMLERGSATARIHHATDDGTMNGQLVLLSPEQWEKIKKTQSQKTIASQMLLNPTAGNEATFSSIWLRTYEIVPRVLNVYILVDPSKGSGKRSDRTAIAVIGIDPAGNKYLLDGACHRMRLTERFRLVEQYKAYWENYDGVQSVKVGWEQYGAQTEIEVVEELLMAKDAKYQIVELNTPRQGGHSKADRIERLEPDIRGGRFYLPCAVYHAEFGDPNGPFARQCYWSVWTQEDADRAHKLDERAQFHIGQIIYRPRRGLTRAQREFEGQGSKRIVNPLRRLDENRETYDLTRVFIDEMVLHPFAPHDDFIDACSRIYDIEPLPPVQYDAKATTSLEADLAATELHTGGEPAPYDD